MNRPLVFLREAQDELDEAYAWYEQQRSGLGDDLLAAVREVLARIQDHPYIYAEVHRGVRRGVIRRFPYGVYYRAESDRIVVIAVYHGSRAPRGWQERS
jgi:plasmid stabilization system protein ParE